MGESVWLNPLLLTMIVLNPRLEYHLLTSKGGATKAAKPVTLERLAKQMVSTWGASLELFVTSELQLVFRLELSPSCAKLGSCGATIEFQ